jgi:hypothetical protein
VTRLFPLPDKFMRTWPSALGDLPGGRSVGKFIVSRTGGAYDAQYRDPNRKFHFIPPPTNAGKETTNESASHKSERCVFRHCGHYAALDVCDCGGYASLLRRPDPDGILANHTSQFAVNLSRSIAKSVCMPLSSRTPTLIPSISIMQKDLVSNKLLSSN